MPTHYSKLIDFHGLKCFEHTEAIAENVGYFHTYDAFELFGFRRKVHVFLPLSFKENPDARFPVLYIPGGQQVLWDVSPSFRIPKVVRMLKCKNSITDFVCVCIEYFPHEIYPEHVEKFIEYTCELKIRIIDLYYRSLPNESYICGYRHVGVLSLACLSATKTVSFQKPTSDRPRAKSLFEEKEKCSERTVTVFKGLILNNPIWFFSTPFVRTEVFLKVNRSLMLEEQPIIWINYALIESEKDSVRTSKEFVGLICSKCNYVIPKNIIVREITQDQSIVNDENVLSSHFEEILPFFFPK